MLRMLTQRQIREIEVYACLEPISWDVGVSEPAKEEKAEGPANETVDVEDKLDAIFKSYERKKH